MTECPGQEAAHILSHYRLEQTNMLSICSYSCLKYEFAYLGKALICIYACLIPQPVS